MRKVHIGRDLKTAVLVHELIGQEIIIHDPRTGSSYKTIISGAKESFGNLRIMILSEYRKMEDAKWFEPSSAELKSIVLAKQDEEGGK